MDSNFSATLVGSDIHGFYTMQDLDVPGIMKEAKSRWLRPNEIHAMLSNYNYFNINVKPVNLPKGGTIVLFDRKKLRNFRKDGHNWKKKKDGKTVKEAHEHLKVGTEERIHVYYAHGEDNPNFVRRCYWLLDKSLEHIVLVHYRETQEVQGSPVTPVNSDFTSDVSDPSASRLLSGESNFNGAKELTEARDSFKITNHEMRLHEINTLEWDELLASNPNEASLPAKENALYSQQYDGHAMYNLEKNGTTLLNEFQANMIPAGNSFNPQGTGLSYNDQQGGTLPLMQGPMDRIVENQSFNVGTSCAGELLYGTLKNGSQGQDSIGMWMNEIMVDSPGSVDDNNYVESSVASHGSFMPPGEPNQGGPIPKQVFCITDISPTWAFSTEETKILVVGFFHQEYQHLAKSSILCICGDTCVPAEIVQVGVFRCLVSPQSPGLVNFYLSIDGSTPISQILTFEFRSLPSTKTDNLPSTKTDNLPQRDMLHIQNRLAHLLFSTSKSIDILSSKVSPSALREGKQFAKKYSTADNWVYFNKLIENGEIPHERVKDGLFELSLKSKLNEWLLERLVDGSKVSERDSQGQGVLHLCAILGYTWAVYPYSSSGLSLDFRDKCGWTALHWAAYFGREKMVAALLSAGAKPNLVTDPTSENPGGCTAADLASKQGFEGLAAFLSEKALVQQFEDMKLAGNVAGSLETSSNDNPINVSEDEVYLKDTLTAYRTAADAAARIQVAFREHAFKQRTMAVKDSNPEDEARSIVAAMKIQHAFRNYESRKKMAAAARIQHRFKTWKLRKEFLNMRRQAIRIQAAFRGFQVRRQYRKIIWSVGVLEKAVLRWRLKRKGLRGLKVEINEPVTIQRQESDLNPEEDFYRASRKQAEQRVEKAVVRVQAMFRSRQAQQEYRRMKLAHQQAELEYEESTRLKLPP